MKIEFTEYHKSWLTENYGKVCRKDCAKHFSVSLTTIDKWVKELGLTIKKRDNVEAQPQKKVEVKPLVEVEIGYCVDCKHYIPGGQCGKTGRITGALNEKPCFKRNTL